MADHCNSYSCAVVPDCVSGSQAMEIVAYRRTKEHLENGQYVASAPFSVGGHSWVIRYFPNGSSKEDADCMSTFLDLVSDASKGVNVKFSFDLLDNAGVQVPLYSKNATLTFTSTQSRWGHQRFVERNDFEGSVHLRDDCFTIRCGVTVIKGVQCVQTKCEQFVVVPPSNLHHHFGDLLKNMEGADVTFKVGEETFFAHRCVLAARSSVFKAKLFGSMRETTHTDTPIEICDMEAEVFKLLLHFIYTDSLSEMAEEPHASAVMAQHLLVAADRYNIERLKLLCEEKLCKHMKPNMVATSLALAEQHSGKGLKKACFDFLASRSNFKAMMVSDGYAHLQKSCPSVFCELAIRSLPPGLEEAEKITNAV